MPLVPRGAVAERSRRALAEGSVVAPRDDQARLRLTGPGRVACLQGLVSCDVEQPGEESATFGALLTNKGMIVAPLSIMRLAGALMVEVPEPGVEATRQAFTRFLPPRQCRWEDVTGATRSTGVYGLAAERVLGDVFGREPPAAPSCAAELSFAGTAIWIARVAARGVDGYDCVVTAGVADRFVQAVTRAGAIAAEAALLEERRILAGFPRLGAEIDDKTIPQEVRFEELGGISYTKGCYLGQETVARVHFRGHPNRRLVGIVLDPDVHLPPQNLVRPGTETRIAGRLSSVAWSEDRSAYVGLAVVRREVDEGDVLLLADGSKVAVHAVPFPAS